MSSVHKLMLLALLINIFAGTNAIAQPAQILPRQDISEFAQNPEHVRALERAVKTMRDNLPVTDKTSWQYQANVHGTYSQGDPQWNQCQHRQWWFLPWHRGYIYYLERMLQKYANDPTLRLPYWNYTSKRQRSLPDAFLNESSPLYVQERAMNSAESELPDEVVDIAHALASSHFEGGVQQGGFGGAKVSTPQHLPNSHNNTGNLENLPHNAIHGLIGGDDGFMSDPNRAAYDPIFWLHHCNIDRLWDIWMQTHQNPSDALWKNQKFSYYNENGQLVSHTVGELLDTKTFGYVYAPSADGDLLNVSHPAENNFLLAATTMNKKALAQITATESSGTVTNQPKTFKLTTLTDVSVLSKDSFLPMSGNKRIKLVLDRVTVPSAIGTVFDVYLNLPNANYTTGAGTKHFVAPLSFFTHHSNQETIEFDVTDILNSMKSEASYDPKKLSVTLVPIGLVKKGQRTKPSNKKSISVGEIRIEVIEPTGLGPEI